MRAVFLSGESSELNICAFIGFEGNLIKSDEATLVENKLFKTIKTIISGHYVQSDPNDQSQVDRVLCDQIDDEKNNDVVPEENSLSFLNLLLNADAKVNIICSEEKYAKQILIEKGINKEHIDKQITFLGIKQINREFLPIEKPTLFIVCDKDPKRLRQARLFIDGIILQERINSTKSNGQEVTNTHLKSTVIICKESWPEAMLDVMEAITLDRKGEMNKKIMQSYKKLDDERRAKIPFPLSFFYRTSRARQDQIEQIYRQSVDPAASYDAYKKTLESIRDEIKREKFTYSSSLLTAIETNLPHPDCIQLTNRF